MIDFTRPRTYVAATLIVFAIVAFFILNPLVKISAGERGVVLRWGAVENIILNEGIHWIAPIVKDVEKMDVTIQKEEKGTSASSKDLQIVSTKVAVNYHLDPLHVNWIYQNLRHEANVRIVAPSIEESIKKTTAKYTAEQLITHREKVKDDLRETISSLLAKSHIMVDDVFMTDFNFSPEFNAAIEAKVTAEQKALQAKNVLEQRKYEAEQTVVSAKAEAEKIKIQAQAVNAQGGKDYVQLKAIEKWDGKLPVQIIPNATLPFLNLGNR